MHCWEPTWGVTSYLDLVWTKIDRRTLASGKTFADKFLNNGHICIKQRRRPPERQTAPSVRMRLIRNPLTFELEVTAYVAPSRILRSGVDNMYRKCSNGLLNDVCITLYPRWCSCCLRKLASKIWTRSLHFKAKHLGRMKCSGVDEIKRCSGVGEKSEREENWSNADTPEVI